MNLINSFSGTKTQLVDPAERRQLLATYQRIRQVSTDLNNRMVNGIPKSDLELGGRRLGMLRKGVFAFSSEGETCVLMDYCLHDIRHGGRNLVEQYFIDTAPEPDSEQFACLQAMQQAFYSLFVIESVERGVGIAVLDLRTHQSLVVIDNGFSNTGKPGTVLASRMIPHDGFHMTAGAALPIAVIPPDDPEFQAILNELAEGAGITPDNAETFDPATLISGCLQSGCSQNVRYQLPNGADISRRIQPHASGSARVARNERCPCGSGRKFKNCCMRRGG